MTRPVTLALASVSHTVAGLAFAALSIWLAAISPDILPRAWPLWGAAVMISATGALCSLSLAYDAARAFARDMGAPIEGEA